MTDEQLLSIVRHLGWADAFRDLAGEAILTSQNLELESFYVKPGGACLLVWYGLLFAICEQLQELKIKIPRIQSDIDTVFDSLRRCRNAVFHVQPEYWSRKLLDFITVEEHAEKVHRIHKGLYEWVAREMLLRGLATPSDFADADQLSSGSESDSQ